MFLYFSWGKKQKKWNLDNSGKTLIASWSYFSFFHCPVKVSDITWILIGNNRNEDRILLENEVARLTENKVPDIGKWQKYGLGYLVLFIIGLFAFLAVVAPILDKLEGR